MAIVGPWIGSSAKAETGQAWMSAAMETLKITRPAFMSTMIGKSKGTIITTAQGYNGSIIGVASAPYNNVGTIVSPEGIYPGGSLIRIAYITQPGYIDLDARGTPTRNISVTLDNITVVFTYLADVSGFVGYPYYRISGGTNFVAFRNLLTSTGVARTLTIV